MTDEKKLTHIDLFSGIGGFTLSGEWAGFRTIVFCEKDEFCKKVLKKHWPEIPIIKEIRDFDGTKWRGATLLTGGFPCQPFSVAGQRRGKEDDRYLWPEMLKIINEARPHWILAENVPGIFRMALDTLLADLEGEGYIAGTFIIPACSLNAPHRRNRVWIVAHAKNANWRTMPNKKDTWRGIKEIRRPNSHASDSQCLGWQEGARKRTEHEKQVSEGQDIRDGNSERIDSNTTGQFGRSEQRSQQSERDAGGKTIGNAWQENWYEVATRFCRVDDGVSDRIHRLKALGNAIVPQIAYEILKNIAWIEDELARRFY